MNVYVCINKLGNLQIVHGDWLKAKRIATTEVRLLGSNDIDDVIYGRIPFSSLPLYKV